jgi:uncharacterized protein with GYD domain
MAYYLFQTAYTSEAVDALIQTPQDRIKAVQLTAEKLGGRIVDAWLAFGEYDVVALLEMPDNVSAVAFSMAASSAGHLKAAKTTPLITFEEGIEAMKKAGGVEYQAPK